MPLTVMTLPRQRYVGAGYYLLPFTLARLFGTSRPMYFMVCASVGFFSSNSMQQYV
jgi:hypothetical protein